MEIIDSPSAMAHALATFQNPWLKRRLADYRDRLIEADCEVGDLGPVIVVDSGDTLLAIEQAANLSLSDAPEYCDRSNSGAELAYVTDDYGAGAVLLLPDLCQWAPKFPQKWALKIPYLVGWVRTVISRNRDRDWLSLVVVRGAYLGVD